MSHQDPGIHPPSYRLPATAHVGRVRLAVSNLERSIAFYRDIIGLAVQSSDAHTASLGPHDTDKVLLELEEQPGLKPVRARSRLGLYHTAFLLPTRDALASFVQHLADRGAQFGAADHLFSEALYLTDPDGLEVEVYADIRRDRWVYERRAEGVELIGAVKPLNFAHLLQTPPEKWQGAPAGTTVGHMHFYVGDLAQGRAFYHAALGMSIASWSLPNALFVSAGGYHHHVGFNTWAARSGPATDQDARLLWWELILPDAESIRQTKASLEAAGYPAADNTFADPWGIRMALKVDTALL
ncbi:catechol 2,3-dioxygenase [Granulicella rosea]|uniref:Catechol 2,3-dioxygenase n=1 Tax=Granulicella rosea TaxID=474952 RepID=A0A239IM74_9BACT|nr:VOC family protein [Granulicella rosea]SNS94133.1 catechol 2,3-dioxygenase [Granulicella rosea]